MTADLTAIGQLLWNSLWRPADVARLLLRRVPARPALWMALGLVAILSVLVMALAPGAGGDGPLAAQGMAMTPLASATVLGALLVMMVFALYYTGLALGGTGAFGAALLLVIWVEALATALRLAGVVVALALGPQAAALFSLFGLGALLWVLVNFIDVLHGFDSLGRAIVTFGLAVLGIGGGLVLILTLIRSLSAGAF